MTAFFLKYDIDEKSDSVASWKKQSFLSGINNVVAIDKLPAGVYNADLTFWGDDRYYDNYM